MFHELSYTVRIIFMLEQIIISRLISHSGVMQYLLVASSFNFYQHWLTRIFTQLKHFMRSPAIRVMRSLLYLLSVPWLLKVKVLQWIPNPLNTNENFQNLLCYIWPRSVHDTQSKNFFILCLALPTLPFNKMNI